MPLSTTRLISTAKIHLEAVAATAGAGSPPAALGKIGILTLHDPTRLNALDVDMGEDFRKAVDHVNRDGGFGALVVRGAGHKAFSAGGDLAFLRERASSSPHVNAKTMRDFYARFLCIREVTCPTVGCINGAAVGAGLGVAMACDLRVVSASAKVGVTFARLGLHPGMGTTHYLPLFLGAQNAADLLLTGRLVSGQRFADMGGALEAVSSGSSVDGNKEDQSERDSQATVERALDLARELVSGSPLAVRACALTLRLKQDEGLHRALQREADAQAQSYASRDLAEGVAATTEKRRAVWVGM